MKKITITALLLASLFTAANARQKKVTFGVGMNAQMTNVRLSDLQGTKGRFNPGVSLEGFTRIYFSDNFSLQPSLALNYTEAKVRWNDDRVKFKYVGIEVPVHMQGHVRAGSGSFVFGIGPHIGYGLSADTRLEKHRDDISLSDAIELDHWYAGGGINAGYEFGIGVYVKAGYQLGFDIASRHKSSGLKTRSVSLGVGYRF